MSAEKWNSFPVKFENVKRTHPFVQTCSFCELLFNFDWKFLLFSLNSIWLSVLLNIKDYFIAWWIVNKLTSSFISKKLLCVDLTYCCSIERLHSTSEVHFLRPKFLHVWAFSLWKHVIVSKGFVKHKNLDADFLSGSATFVCEMHTHSVIQHFFLHLSACLLRLLPKGMEESP